MADFFQVEEVTAKNGVVEIKPAFLTQRVKDLMIRGEGFYAVWLPDQNRWSTDEFDAIELIDQSLRNYVDEHRETTLKNKPFKVYYLRDSKNKKIDEWKHYVNYQMIDQFHQLDEKLIFSNMKPKKTDYSSKSLPYPLEPATIDAYDSMMSVLYSPEERTKIEWAIGAIVTGDSRFIQKFLVFYGPPKTGKSTVLNIIQKLFAGYFSAFDARSLGIASNLFALEQLKDNPLVVIQHDGDLSEIEDNTRLNSVVSHEMVTVNPKHRSPYTTRFNSFLFLGTNKPVKITDSKSGLLRRLIDVHPTGKRIDPTEYEVLYKQIDFELGGIAYHCQNVYLEDPHRYDNYVPTDMMTISNDFYNFMLFKFLKYKEEDGVALKTAWADYQEYNEFAQVKKGLPYRQFKEELKEYFRDVVDRFGEDRTRSYYIGFKTEKFVQNTSPEEPQKNPKWLTFVKQKSVLDDICKDCPAQYGTRKETPTLSWDEVTTTISDLNTSRLHYVRLPLEHIVIDFDIPDKDGNKSLDENMLQAAKWPPTYAELSKSGQGIHLHYIYSGDPTELARLYDDHIEIKVFSGKSSLRRKLTKCNDLPVATLSSGLPKKGKKMLNKKDIDMIHSERELRNKIMGTINKEYIPQHTVECVSFILQLTNEAYEAGFTYDISDLEMLISTFAACSTNSSKRCLEMVGEMHFKSADQEPEEETSVTEMYKSGEEYKKEDGIVIFDCEVFPNLFLICWKLYGKDNPVISMVNPSPSEVEELFTKFNLVGFNNRGYDNHILYARYLGYSNQELFELSMDIVKKRRKNPFFPSAYNISYADVFDFSAEKKGLKKFEIQDLDDCHLELAYSFEEPLPPELWSKAIEYCTNDVLATEAVFDLKKPDFAARQIQADIAGMTVNDKTNTLTTKIIFGNNKTPQRLFNYRNLGDTSGPLHDWNFTDDLVMYSFEGDENDINYNVFDDEGRPVFPGYKHENGVSTYRGEVVGEGGYVYAEPGMYSNVWVFDVASMHPSSIIAEKLFGKEYTKRYKDIVEGRIAVKHLNKLYKKQLDADSDEKKAQIQEEIDKIMTDLKGLLDGKIVKHLTDLSKTGDLAQALKIAINSVYGLTAAKFDNPFRDPRNIDNIVAKRGGLFMINLKHEVQKRGFQVIHIKTDSIKISNPTEEIKQFILDYGKAYGYNFECDEHHDIYEKMCLVNQSTYIAKDATGEWVAVGDQFKVPYVFKTLFSKEPIIFKDLCVMKAAKVGEMYLDMNEPLEAELAEHEADLKALKKDIKKEKISQEEYDEKEAQILHDISLCHSYRFVGKVGEFCPIKEGCGGGTLYVKRDDKYASVSGTKGWKFIESAIVKNLGLMDSIDRDYFQVMVDEAVHDISQYGDFEQFSD